MIPPAASAPPVLLRKAKLAGRLSAQRAEVRLPAPAGMLGGPGRRTRQVVG